MVSVFQSIVRLRCAGISHSLPFVAVKVVEGVVGGIEYERGSARGRSGTPMEVTFLATRPRGGGCPKGRTAVSAQRVRFRLGVVSIGMCTSSLYANAARRSLVPRVPPQDLLQAPRRSGLPTLDTPTQRAHAL